MAMATTVNIRIIDNRNKRLELIRPLLDYLANKNLAKKDNGLYIVNSSLMSRPITEAEHLFKVLQESSARSGFQFNCYNLKND